MRFAFRAIIVFLACTAGLLRAQSPPPDSLAPVVDTVLVSGNSTTDSDIILREMSLRKDSLITPEKVRYDRDRIYSLRLFTKVDLVYDGASRRTPLLVMVRERWYIFPVPMFGFRDRDWKKPYYGLGFLHDNFRGMNEKLWAGFSLGYDPWASIAYKSPWISREHNLFFETEISWSKPRNRSLLAQGKGPNYDQLQTNASFLFGKRLTLFTSLWSRFEYNRLSVNETRAGRTVSPDGVDNLAMLSLGASYDTRDFKEYATDGTYLNGGLSYGKFFEGKNDYVRLLADARRFIRFSPAASVGVRAFAEITGGNAVPAYRHVYFGYLERIRGYFYDTIEGENIFGSTVELRIKLLQPVYIHVSEIPVPQFDTWRIAVDLALFSDGGTVWFRNENPLDKKFYAGFGAGIHVELPYSFVVRFDYAFNQSLKGQFIFDLNASI